jgi:hypothetical protein
LEKTLHSIDDDETMVKQSFQSPEVCRADHRGQNGKYQNVSNQSSFPSEYLDAQPRHIGMKKSMYLGDNTLEFFSPKNVTASDGLNDLSNTGGNGSSPDFIPNIILQSESYDTGAFANERESFENNF